MIVNKVQTFSLIMPYSHFQRTPDYPFSGSFEKKVSWDCSPLWWCWWWMVVVVCQLTCIMRQSGLHYVALVFENPFAFRTWYNSCSFWIYMYWGRLNFGIPFFFFFFFYSALGRLRKPRFQFTSCQTLCEVLNIYNWLSSWLGLTKHIGKLQYFVEYFVSWSLLGG